MLSIDTKLDNPWERNKCNSCKFRYYLKDNFCVKFGLTKREINRGFTVTLDNGTPYNTKEQECMRWESIRNENAKKRKIIRQKKFIIRLNGEDKMVRDWTTKSRESKQEKSIGLTCE